VAGEQGIPAVPDLPPGEYRLVIDFPPYGHDEIEASFRAAPGRTVEVVYNDGAAARAPRVVPRGRRPR
jgi:hypothetical protein